MSRARHWPRFGVCQVACDSLQFQRQSHVYLVWMCRGEQTCHGGEQRCHGEQKVSGTLSKKVLPPFFTLRVRDNGRGIARESLPRVSTLSGSPGRGEKGGHRLGLGLALVKSLVELHGGTIAAHSEGPSTGGEFIVRLPA